MSVVDVLQILMHEPRVAFKQAQLIAVEAQMKEVANGQQLQAQKKVRSVVMKSDKTDKKQKAHKTQQGKTFLKIKGGQNDASSRRVIDLSV